MCSAAIISSTTDDLICTAAHCAYDTNRKIWYDSYWVFIPAYSEGGGNYGTWLARKFITFSEWANKRNFDYDVAFIALSTLNGWHIQSYLGSQGIGFNFPHVALTYALGYPGNINNGETLSICGGFSQTRPHYYAYYNCLQLPCKMKSGSSGGPWLQDTDEETGMGSVTSVVSFNYGHADYYINGPYFGSNVKSLYDIATTM